MTTLKPFSEYFEPLSDYANLHGTDYVVLSGTQLLDKNGNKTCINDAKVYKHYNNYGLNFAAKHDGKLISVNWLSVAQSDEFVHDAGIILTTEAVMLYRAKTNALEESLVEVELQNTREFIEQFSRLDQYDMGLLTEAEYYRLETPANVTPSVEGVPAWGLAWTIEDVNADPHKKYQLGNTCYCCFESLPDDHESWLHIVEGGLYAVHPLFEKHYDGSDCDMYYHPICPTCMKKFPQLGFFADSGTLLLGDFVKDAWPSIPDPLYPDDVDDSLGDLVTPEMEESWELEQERYGEARHWEQQAEYEVNVFKEEIAEVVFEVVDWEIGAWKNHFSEVQHVG